MACPDSSPRPHCQNCGAPLTGPYCAACGQHDVDYHRSFWHIAEDALEGFFHFDGKFLRSARYLFTRPGFLTTEFIAGRRVRYTHPIRFYFFASFLFFTVGVLTSRNPALTEAAQAGQKTPKPMENAVKADRNSADTVAALESKPTPADPANASLPKDAGRRSWLDDPLRLKFDSTDQGNFQDFTNEFWHLLPAMLFFCLPLLALALKLIYIRSGRLYVEHLIFALHIQAFAFLSFILIKMAGLLASLAGKGAESAVGTVLLMGMFFVIYCAFRTAYGQSRGRTAVKLALTIAAYGLILIFASACLGVASVLLVSRNS